MVGRNGARASRGVNAIHPVQPLESRWLLAADVVIDEIMYHPAGGDIKQEYVELFNRGDADANLSGWRFTKGIDYALPDGTGLAAGGYLVVAADVSAFQQAHPGIANVVGGWTGQLSNSHEEIRLVNAGGGTVDSVSYADEGDWAVRRRGPLDHGHQGWIWVQPADGEGSSLELINPSLPNDAGQNWSSSQIFGGTPGGPNSVAATNIAPLILDLAQSPIVPHSTDSVTITARVVDESPVTGNVVLHYRLDAATPPAFSTLAMRDDGTGGDATAGDSNWTAVLPPRPDKSIIEFYVSATDGSHLRTYPGPTDASGTQGANALYQVDDSVYSGAQTQVKLIMTEKERAELASIGAPGSSSRDSNAQMNGTFVGIDSHGAEIRYNVGIRNRGGGSRTAQPNNYRVNFAADRTWRGVRGINLNGQYSMEEVAADAVLRMAGVPSQDVQAVQVRVNAANLASTTQFDMFGSYSLVEVEDGDMVDNHFPTDNDGNYYRGVDAAHNANLSYLGDDPAAYFDKYPKQNNTDFLDYADIIALTKALDPDITPDSNFVQTISQKIDVTEWLRYFAVNALLGNEETSLGTGYGDDFSLYAGVIDPRFKLIAHDLDTVLGRGDSPDKVNPNESLFKAAAVPAVSRLLKNPTFAPLYYAQLLDLINTTFSPSQIGPTLDNALRGYVPQSVINTMKTFAADRVAGALAQIPQALTASTTLTAQNGYPRTTSATAPLGGKADVLKTRSVKVNGLTASYTPWQGTWSAPSVSLTPGINRVLVQALDENGTEISRTYLDIWRDRGATTNVSGTLPAGVTHWTAANGPYRVTSNLTVPAGATLQIDPGVSVFFESGTGLIVNGTLNARGTDSRRIRFTRTPTSTGRWNGIRFVYGSSLPTASRADNQITFADIEYSDNGSESIYSSNAKLTLDHVIWGHHGKQYLNINDSSLSLKDSTLPTVSNAELVHFAGFPSDGFAIIQHNTFGSTTGYNDIIDLTGGKRPGPIAQFLNNTFLGGSDDGLDLDGTDAQIEGNVFMHFHQDAPRESKSHAISTGTENGFSSNITIARNFFYDVDHAIIIKDGSFGTIVQNTIVHVHKLIPDATEAAINLYEPRSGQFPAVGVFLDGNIFQDIPRLFENPVTPGFPTNPTISVNHSDYPLIAGEQAYPGVGNIHEDPRLVNTTNVTDPRVDFQLRPGSPAIGTGPNGRDMGAAVLAGASISGEPIGTTSLTSVTLQVGGKELYAYRYRINGGAFSDEVAVQNPGKSNAVVPPIVLSDLPDGTYTIQVVGKNSAGVWQPDDQATTSRTFTIDRNASRLLINEVLASNVAAVLHEGSYPDLVELYNDSASPRDLSGMSITDDPSSPRKFVFPAGTMIGAGEYLVLYADRATSVPGIHVGFALSAGGESVSLYDTPANGGGLIDSVVFGQQLSDFAIGRLPNGGWGLATPTFGAANVATRTGDTSTLKINEWLADGVTPFKDDFIELYNPDPLPVALGGLHLTDEPIDWPQRATITPLTFIAGGGFQSFTADGKDEAGHVNFHLAREQGNIGLADASLKPIDRVVYGLQKLGSSQGRSPDGGPLYAFFTQPTPSASNQVSTAISSLPLRITEIMYHPMEPDAGSPFTEKDFEYLELQNVGAQPLDLTGVKFSFGVAFNFPSRTLAPGEYVLLVSNQAAFESRYGTALPVLGEFTGNLDNGGERLRLEDAAGATILDFAYGDESWFPVTDGVGKSLVILDPSGDPNTWGIAASWRPSNFLNGSPGVAEPVPDTVPPTADVVDVTPDPRSQPIDFLDITFTEPVVGLDLSDLVLTRDGGSNLLTGDQTLTTTDHITWRLGNLAGLTAAPGTYKLSLAAQDSGVIDLGGNDLAGNAEETWQVAAAAGTVVGRHVFYDNSHFDLLSDDDAIATDKNALLPGQSASFANVTSYSKGINGVMIDVSGPIGAISADDFDFRVGNGGDPSAWAAAPAPSAVVVRPASGDAPARIEITWPDGAIKNVWLQVTLKATAATVLSAPDVFYFGNLVGDAADTGALGVNASDLVRTRNAIGHAAAIDDPTDFNRDGIVNAADLVLARNAIGKSLAPITQSPGAGSLVAPPNRSLFYERTRIIDGLL